LDQKGTSMLTLLLILEQIDVCLMRIGREIGLEKDHDIIEITPVKSLPRSKFILLRGKRVIRKSQVPTPKFGVGVNKRSRNY